MAGNVLAICREEIAAGHAGTGEIRKSWDWPGVPASLAFASDNKHLLIGNRNSTISVLRLNDGIR